MLLLAPKQALAKLHPAGLSDDWADKLAGQEFFSRAAKATFEHYMQVRSSTALRQLQFLTQSVHPSGRCLPMPQFDEVL